MANEVSKKNTQVQLLNSYLKREDIQSKFLGMMSETKKNQFMVSLVNAYSINDYLQKCHPVSVIQASLVAGALNLPIEQNLGFAYIVPFWNAKAKEFEAQLQIGYKGLTQLCLRTNQYKQINAITVFENQFKSFDRLTETFDADFTIEGEGKIVGYVAYIELKTGFKKTVFWTTKKVESHAKKYSQSYKKGFGVWKDNFEAMAQKTVLKNLLTHYGIMSVEMQTAETNDQRVFGQDNSDFLDNKEETEELTKKDTSADKFEKARKEAEDVSVKKKNKNKKTIDNKSDLEDELKGTPFEEI